ncbi:glycosyltransferase [Siminovitchia fortis]|uniref:glycosyltransferase n=1 Tax=Siminovitchia fortis TaxID=254758 RepID=UPI0021B17613|nr:glycosyltransferase [Siminovitchia fortis]
MYRGVGLMRRIKEKDGDRRFVYMGREKGLEGNIMGRENLGFERVEIRGFKRSLWFENIKRMMGFFKGVRGRKEMIKEFKGDVVIGRGG